MSKKDEDLTYSFQPGRTLNLEEVTEILKKVIGNWRMDANQYKALPEELKDVFFPVKE
jgi:hypothetical protein